MPKTKKTTDIDDGETWKKHNLYDVGCSINRIVTRSQTPFNRIKNSASDLDLFANPSSYHPSGLPHLMVTMKGEYGAIPMTIITRSTGKQLELSKKLMEKLDEYKKKAGVYTGSSVKRIKEEETMPKPGKSSKTKGKFYIDGEDDQLVESYRKVKGEKTRPEKRRKTNEKVVFDKKETWRNHNLYDIGCSINRIVTRSQTAFNRIKNSASDLDLFADPSSYQPPGLPHLMVTMKGEYGAIPMTIITRSTGNRLEISKKLCEKLDEYKKKRRKD